MNRSNFIKSNDHHPRLDARSLRAKYMLKLVELMIDNDPGFHDRMDASMAKLWADSGKIRPVVIRGVFHRTWTLEEMLDHLGLTLPGGGS